MTTGMVYVIGCTIYVLDGCDVTNAEQLKPTFITMWGKPGRDVYIRDRMLAVEGRNGNYTITDGGPIHPTSGNA